MAKPIIGSKYAKTQFELRLPNGEYRCLDTPAVRPTDVELWQQQLLLNKEVGRDTSLETVGVLVVWAFVFAAVLSLGMAFA